MCLCPTNNAVFLSYDRKSSFCMKSQLRKDQNKHQIVLVTKPTKEKHLKKTSRVAVYHAVERRH